MSKHWREFFDEKFMGSWDLLQGDKFVDRIVTIERFGKSDLATEKGKEKKTVIKFKEFPKEMICNKTNFKRLEKAFGTFDPEKFVGKKVTLTTEKVKNPKDQTFVDALRIKEQAPAAPELKPLTQESPRWGDMVAALQRGEATVDLIKTRYTLTPEIEAILKTYISSGK